MKNYEVLPLHKFAKADYDPERGIEIVIGENSTATGASMSKEDATGFAAQLNQFRPDRVLLGPLELSNPSLPPTDQ